MYINFNFVLEKGLIPQDILFLHAVKQRSSKGSVDHVAMTMDDERYEFLLQKELIHLIKGTKKMSDIEKIRLTTKGTKFLHDVSTAEVTEEDIVIRDWLVKIFRDMGKSIGNKKRIGTGIAQFRVITGIDRNKLSFLLKTFVTDEENMEYNHKLQNAFYPDIRDHTPKFNIDDCRLYDYYIRKKNFFDNKFSTL